MLLFYSSIPQEYAVVNLCFRAQAQAGRKKTLKKDAEPVIRSPKKKVSRAVSKTWFKLKKNRII